MVFPAGILTALAPRIASAVSVRAVAAALNHLLKQHPDARRRLAAHAGKRVRIGLDDSAAGVVRNMIASSQLWFDIDEQGALQSTGSGEADASLLVKPSIQAATDMASGGRGELARHLRVEGDVLLAGLLGEIIQGLQWDYEDDLSRVIGDIPARRVGELASRMGAAGQQVSGAVGRRVSQAMTGARNNDDPGAQSSQAPLVSRGQFDALNAELQALRARIAQLEEQARSAGSE